MAKTILVLGAGPYQVPAIHAARKAGCKTVVVDGNPNAPGFAAADVVEVVDLRDVAGCIAVARAHRIQGVVSICAEVAVEATAEVADAMKLPGISPEAALAATDKYIMRQRLSGAGVSCPRFLAATCMDEAERAAMSIGYPLVVKPVDNAGSRGVRKVDSPQFLGEAFREAIACSRKKKAIIEEFMPGTEATIEAMTFGGQTEILAISDKEHVPYPYCVSISLNYPPIFDMGVQQEIRKTVIASVEALGINFGPTHSEVMVTPDGVKVVEVAARGGGFRVFSDMVPLVSGVNVVDETVRMALGESPDIKAKYSRGAILRFFNPAQRGTLKEVVGVEEAKALPGVVDIVIDTKPGDLIRRIATDGDRPGYFIATGADRQAAIALAERVESLVRFEVSPS